MKQAMGLLISPARLAVTAGAIVWLSAALTGAARAQAQTTASKLEFRSLAATDDGKDKAAVKAWKEAFEKAKDDTALQKKLQEAALAGKAPELVAPKMPAEGQEADKNDPGSYQFIKVTTGELAMIGLNLYSTFKKDVDVQKKIEAARTKGEAIAVPGKNVYLFSRKGQQAGAVEYFVLARPVSSEISLEGKDIASATTAVDEKNRYGVLVKLTTKGSEKFKAFTEANQKHYLVIMVNQRIVHAAKLAEPITSGELEISGNIDRTRAQNIEAAIRQCIPKAATE